MIFSRLIPILVWSGDYIIVTSAVNSWLLNNDTRYGGRVRVRREREEGKREGENSFWISAYKRTLLVFKWQNRQSIFYSRHLINVHVYFAVHITNV